MDDQRETREECEWIDQKSGVLCALGSWINPSSAIRIVWRRRRRCRGTFDVCLRASCQDLVDRLETGQLAGEVVGSMAQQVW